AAGRAGLSAHGQDPSGRGPERLPAPEVGSRGARRDPQRRQGGPGADQDAAVRMIRLALTALALFAAAASPAAAQQLDLGGLTQQLEGQTIGTIVQLFGLLT